MELTYGFLQFKAGVDVNAYAAVTHRLHKRFQVTTINVSRLHNSVFGYESFLQV